MLDVILDSDLFLFHLINHGFTHEWFDVFFATLTDLNKNPWFKFFIFPFILVFWFYKGKKKALYVFLIMAMTAGVADQLSYHVLKKSFKRPRPNHLPEVQSVLRVPYGPKSYSFPSNHALSTASVVTVLALYYPVTKYFAGILIFLIAYSRVYVGVHYPLDVLVGSFLGMLLGFMIYKFTKKWNRWG